MFDFKNFFTFDSEGGINTFLGNRMLLFNADALGQLRQELIESLGKDIARGVLTRFGYRCGYADVLSVRNMFNLETDAEWMLAWPMIHTMEGSGRVNCDQLEFNRDAGTFFMRGQWHNSYEVEQHLKLYGPATEAVCWAVSGYASGYASGFMGREIVAVEMMCGAKGDPYCNWELRPAEEWGREADSYIEDLRPSSVVKSLQKLVTEERERVVQWRGLNEAAVEITTNYDSDKLPRRFIQYAAKMFFAQASSMALITEDGQYLVYKTKEAEVWSEITSNPGVFLTPVLKTGRAIVVRKDSLGVPLYYKGSMIGAMVVVKKQGNRAFNHEDQELLQILGAQAAIAIQNARVYERTDEELQEKVLQLHQLNNVLTAQHAKLKKSTDIHTQLTQLVLECQGLEAIAQTLAELINCHVWVEDENFRLIASSGENSGLEKGFLSIGHLMKVKRYRLEMLSLVHDKRLVTIETDPAGRRQIIVPIVAGKEVLGYVSVLEKEKKQFELDYIAMEQAGRVFALELLKQKAAMAVEMRQSEDFIEDLIAGNYESEEAAYRRSAQLGFVFVGPYQVFIIDVENREASYPGASVKRRFYELVKEVVQRESPGSIVISNRYILVLAAINASDKNNPLAKAIEKDLNGQGGDAIWWLAVGGNCNRLDEFKESYWQATSTLEIMKSLNQENRMMSYERLGVFTMLEINKERFAKFANRVLRPLIDYDRKHNAQLVSMLELYYRNNGNILKAAREGFLNHSTMKYRLKRIEEIAGIDMDDPDVGLQIQLALKLIM